MIDCFLITHIKSFGKVLLLYWALMCCILQTSQPKETIEHYEIVVIKH